ncbi:unnamed protein product [Spirodela intermedia]|uniref:Uncharacterized protein n=1 Tax=Spirodela intermedia TaxID=51605 RepID=A0ABN7E8S4_SPIIN|nr:unnamed protein product [Spirodela intermedia]
MGQGVVVHTREKDLIRNVVLLYIHSKFWRTTDRKNGNFAALRRLSPDEEELDGGGAPSSSGPRSKRRLFIASGTLSGGGDWSPDRSSSSR